jgi:pimeloyl-ACP methyl ester carboxylesterase
MEPPRGSSTRTGWLRRAARRGRSERRPPDVSRQAFVDDLAAWIDVLGLAPAVVIGQSLGGHTAFLLAAQRPDLVRALVVAEATPAIDHDAPRQVRERLDAWPAPFAGRGDALAYFGDTAWGRAVADGLEHRQDGLWPAFDVDVMVARPWRSSVSAPTGTSGAPSPARRSWCATRAAGWAPSRPSGWCWHARQPVRPRSPRTSTSRRGTYPSCT